MKLKDTKNREIVVGGLKEMNFSIDESSPIIFDILRSKMYSNKIGAVCREISSNSRDANREAGLNDKPIEIQITTPKDFVGIGETCIIFRDFGLGINPDRMANVFLKYAASTKRDSNAQTGGFGLGAKTPFAYTDSFLIRTTCECIEENNITKKEYLYNAIIDSTGKGKMLLLDEKESDKMTGTEIIVPINNNNDLYSFETECYKSTLFWDNVNYVNFISKKPQIETIFSGESFKIIKPCGVFSSYSEHYLGLIDGIPYPLKPTKASKGLGDNFQILIDVDVENVTINANRENIQYDESTLLYLNDKVIEIEEFLLEKFNEYFDNNDNYLDALRKHYFLNTNRDYNVNYSPIEKLVLACKENYSDRLLKDYKKDIFYNGEKVKKNFGLKYHDFIKCTVYDLETDDDEILSVKFKYKEIDTFIRYNESTIYYLDEKRFSSVKNLQIIDNEPKDYFLVIKKKKGITDEMVLEDILILENLNIPYTPYSSVKTIKKISSKKNKTTTETLLYTRNYSNLYDSNSLWYDKETNQIKQYEKILNNDKIAFITVNSLKNLFFELNDKIESKINVLLVLNILDNVYIINETTYRNHLQKNGHKLVDDVYKLVDERDLYLLRDYKQINETLNKKIPKILINNFKEILPKNIDKILEVSEKIDKFAKTLTYSSRIDKIYWEELGVNKSKMNYDGMVDKINRILKLEYPLLLPYLDKIGLFCNSYKVTNLNIDMNSLSGRRIHKIINNYIKSTK